MDGKVRRECGVEGPRAPALPVPLGPRPGSHGLPLASVPSVMRAGELSLGSGSDPGMTLSPGETKGPRDAFPVWEPGPPPVGSRCCAGDVAYAGSEVWRGCAGV